jgi:hypothetical protein
VSPPPVDEAPAVAPLPTGTHVCLDAFLPVAHPGCPPASASFAFCPPQSIPLRKVLVTFLGPPRLAELDAQKSPGFATKTFSLFTAAKQASGTDLFLDDARSARTFFRVLDGLVGFLRNDGALSD